MAIDMPGFARSRELNSGAPAGWKQCMPVTVGNPLVTEGPPIGWSAVISTWNDADIVGANIRNCFDNGCSEVVILDNASDDFSVREAEFAGAVIGEVYETEFYDDDLRIRKQNLLVQSRVEKQASPDHWWAFLDADEFVVGRGGEPLIDTLQSVWSGCRTIGTNVVDLFPTDREYVRGDHPATCFDFGVRKKEGRGVYCAEGHYKHVLLRYSGGRYDIAQTRGNHCPAVSGNTDLFEPAITLPMFHAPFRRKEDTFARLKKLCTKDRSLGGRHRSAGDDQVTGNNGAIKRWQSLEHVYAGRWDEVEIAHSQLYGRAVKGIALYPWRTIFPELAGMFR